MKAYSSQSQKLSGCPEFKNQSISLSHCKMQAIGGSSNSTIYSLVDKNNSSSILKVINHNDNDLHGMNHNMLTNSNLSSHCHECKHLENEFKTLKKLDHPNIIKLQHEQLYKDTSIQNTNISGCFLLLEKGNCDLLQMLSSVYPNVLEVSYLKYSFKRVAEAMQYLHDEKKIAHNDIKLENIILFNSEPKISDFGFASKHESDPLVQVKNWLHRSKTNVAPEIINNMKKLQAKQFDDIKTFDERKTDVFALGIALFNALIHQNPFESVADISDPLFSKFYNESGDYSDFWNDAQISRMLDFISSAFDSSKVSELKDLFEGMLNPNPKKRFSMKQVLSHSWFDM